MKYVCSVDLGSERDYTAISIVERILKKRDPNIPAKGLWVPKKEPVTIVSELHLIDMQRVPLKTPYPKICEALVQIVNDPEYVNQIQLIVDRTGAGIPIIQMMYLYDLCPLGITINSGYTVSTTKDNYSVPKRDLIHSLLAAIYTHRFRTPPPSEMEIIQIFKEELQGFQMKTKTDTGFDTYEAAMERVHDDLVISAAMAVWWFDKTHGTSTVIKQGEE